MNGQQPSWRPVSQGGTGSGAFMIRAGSQQPRQMGFQPTNGNQMPRFPPLMNLYNVHPPGHQAFPPMMIMNRFLVPPNNANNNNNNALFASLLAAARPPSMIQPQQFSFQQDTQTTSPCGSLPSSPRFTLANLSIVDDGRNSLNISPQQLKRKFSPRTYSRSSSLSEASLRFASNLMDEEQPTEDVKDLNKARRRSFHEGSDDDDDDSSFSSKDKSSTSDDDDDDDAEDEDDEDYDGTPRFTPKRRFAPGLGRKMSQMSTPSVIHRSGSSSSLRVNPVHLGTRTSPVAVRRLAQRRTSSLHSETDSPGGEGGCGGLGGERRLSITFLNLGDRFNVKEVQSFGKYGWVIPDGLSGTHRMYSQDWRFRIDHHECLGTVVLQWTVANLTTESFVSVTESPQQALTRQTKGNTICNTVLRRALDARATELEEQIRQGGLTPLQVANLESLVKELRPKQCTEGLLFFGLRHECVQRPSPALTNNITLPAPSVSLAASSAPAVNKTL